MGNSTIQLPSEPDEALIGVYEQALNERAATGLAVVHEACERILARIPAATRLIIEKHIDARDRVADKAEA